MGSPKSRNHKLEVLNPSLVTRSKSCKEMGEKFESTLSLEEVYFIVTTARRKIVVLELFEEPLTLSAHKMNE